MLGTLGLWGSDCFYTFLWVSISLLLLGLHIGRPSFLQTPELSSLRSLQKEASPC